MQTIQIRFVEYIPEKLEELILYISIEYATAMHLCACGCGSRVVTPIAPTGWKMIYDGEMVSLYPSIGNWSLPCESHYWIEKNKIIHSDRWSKEQIKKGAAKDKKLATTFLKKRKKDKKQ